MMRQRRASPSTAFQADATIPPWSQSNFLAPYDCTSYNMRCFLPAVAAGSALLSLATASTLTPPVLPLTVRNPYLSTWLGDARINPWNKWPMFWTGEEVRSSRKEES